MAKKYYYFIILLRCPASICWPKSCAEMAMFDIDSAANDSTICAICGALEKSHKDHQFFPAKFGTIHSDQPVYANRRGLKIFNDPSNIDGRFMKVLIGAQKIRESIDLKAVKHMLLVSMPENISTLIQIIGRAIRKGAFAGLADNRCFIYLLTIDYEEDEYKAKMKDYLEIQHADQIINSVAADAAIHRNIILPTLGESLGALPYEPLVPINNTSKISLPYYAYDIYNQEIYIIKLLLIRLFFIQSAWEYGPLWVAARNPPFRTEINPESFTEDNFIIALNELLSWQIKKIDKFYVKLPIVAPDAQTFGSGIRPVKIIPLVVNKDSLINAGVDKFNDAVKKIMSESRVDRKFKLSDLIIETPADFIEEVLRRDFKQGCFFWDIFGFFIKGRDVDSGFPSNATVGIKTRAGPMALFGKEWRRVNLKPVEIGEVGPIIGFTDEHAGKVTFKIRRTLKDLRQFIEEQKITDLRLVERGAVCGTWNREELIAIAKTLSRRYNHEMIDYVSVRDLCEYIRRMLMTNDYHAGGTHRIFYWYYENRGPMITKI